MPSYAPGWPRPGGASIKALKGSALIASSINLESGTDIAVLPKPTNTDYFPKGKATDQWIVWGATYVVQAAGGNGGAFVMDGGVSHTANTMDQAVIASLYTGNAISASVFFPQGVKISPGSNVLLDRIANGGSNKNFVTVYATRIVSSG